MNSGNELADCKQDSDSELADKEDKVPTAAYIFDVERKLKQGEAVKTNELGFKDKESRYTPTTSVEVKDRDELVRRVDHEERLIEVLDKLDNIAYICEDPDTLHEIHDLREKLLGDLDG